MITLLFHHFSVLLLLLLFFGHHFVQHHVVDLNSQRLQISIQAPQATKVTLKQAK